jgi:hypothetical protein
MYATVMPVPINVDFLNQVCVATIGDLVSLDIKCHLDKDDKFKVEGDLLYFKERLFIPECLTQLLRLVLQASQLRVILDTTRL